MTRLRHSIIWLLTLLVSVLLLTGPHVSAQPSNTAVAEMFGDGRDGDLVVGPGQTVAINTFPINVSGENIFVFPENSIGFSVGDTVLFHQTQRTVNVGRWELNQIVSINSPTRWTLATPLLYRYDNTNGQAVGLLN